MPGFALLKHTMGEAVHYDLVLQRGRTLKTWSLQTPLAEPGVCTPATARFDHDLRFLNYEGPLSEGKGAVEAVDRGRYRLLEWQAEADICVRLSGNRLSGTLRLRRREGDEWDLAFVAEPAARRSGAAGQRVKPPGLMRVGEVARRSGLSREVINTYAMFGLISEAERAPSGHRLFGPDVLKRLRMIGLLKRRGYTLRDIREIFLKDK